ncbi:MAG: hypothetical protein ABW101_16210 [Candidatus Thiodiazotropha sp.]
MKTLLTTLIGISSLISITSAQAEESKVEGRAEVGGITYKALLSDQASILAEKLSIPVSDIKALNDGKPIVLKNLTLSEKEAYDYYKRIYGQHFEVDFAGLSDDMFNKRYQDAWNRIHLHGSGMTMGSDFEPRYVEVNRPTVNGTEMGTIKRLIVKPGNTYIPGSNINGKMNSADVYVFDGSGVLWTTTVSNTAQSAWTRREPKLNDQSVKLDSNSVAYVANGLIGLDNAGGSILYSVDGGSVWNAIARNDDRFDEDRKQIARDQGFDDKNTEKMLRQYLERVSKTITDSELHDYVWLSEKQKLHPVVSFRSDLSEPNQVHVLLRNGKVSTLSFDELKSKKDIYAVKMPLVEESSAMEWNADSKTFADFAIRKVAGKFPDNKQVTQMRVLAVLPDDLRISNPLKRDALEFALWQQAELNLWRSGSIALFNDLGNYGQLSRKSDPLTTSRFVSGFFAGDGQLVYGLNDQDTLFYALDTDERVYDYNANALARSRADRQLEDWRIEFNQLIEKANKEKKPLKNLPIGDPVAKAYNDIAKIRWIELGNDITAATGSKAGVWAALKSGDLRFYQTPAIKQSGSLAPRPSASDLIDIEEKLSLAVGERSAISQLTETAFDLTSDVQKHSLSDLNKFETALRLRNGGLDKPKISQGDNGIPGSSPAQTTVSGVAAVVSEVPVAATIWNIANYVTGLISRAPTPPSMIDNPAYKTFEALRSIKDMENSYIEAFNVQRQSLRFSKHLCLSNPDARSKCLQAENLFSNPEKPFNTTVNNISLMPDVDDNNVQQNSLQSRYISIERETRQNIRCLAWQTLLPRTAFFYGNTQAITTEEKADPKHNLMKQFGATGQNKSVPVAVVITSALPEQSGQPNKNIAIAWTIRVGTKETNQAVAITDLLDDGYDDIFNEGGKVILSKPGPGNLSTADWIYACPLDSRKQMLSASTKWAEAVRIVKVNGKSFSTNWYDAPLALMPENLLPVTKLSEKKVFLSGYSVNSPLSTGKSYYFEYSGTTPVWFEDWEAANKASQ